MVISRILGKNLISKLHSGKILILYGPRQCGKTTLLKMLVESQNLSYAWFNGDEPDVRVMLPNKTSTELKRLIGDKKLLIIDEHQMNHE